MFFAVDIAILGPSNAADFRSLPAALATALTLLAALRMGVGGGCGFTGPIDRPPTTPGLGAPGTPGEPGLGADMLILDMEKPPLLRLRIDHARRREEGPPNRAKRNSRGYRVQEQPAY